MGPMLEYENLMKVRKRVDRRRLENVLSNIFSEGRGVMLAKEIKGQLLVRDLKGIRRNTYERLGRWCHPRSWARRDHRVKEWARQTSRLLFGRVIPRCD